MTQLAPCPTCQRHVKIDETACPFCATPLELISTPARAMPAGWMGRAAVFAFGIAASACGDNDPRKTPTHDAAFVPKDSSIDASPFDAFIDNDAPITIYASAPVDGGFDDNANENRGKS